MFQLYPCNAEYWHLEISHGPRFRYNPKTHHSLPRNSLMNSSFATAYGVLLWGLRAGFAGTSLAPLSPPPTLWGFSAFFFGLDFAFPFFFGGLFLAGSRFPFPSDLASLQAATRSLWECGVTGRCFPLHRWITLSGISDFDGSTFKSKGSWDMSENNCWI